MATADTPPPPSGNGNGYSNLNGRSGLRNSWKILSRSRLHAQMGEALHGSPPETPCTGAGAAPLACATAARETTSVELTSATKVTPRKRRALMFVPPSGAAYPQHRAYQPRL